MRKILSLTAMLLLAGSVVFAQNQTPDPSTPSTQQSTQPATPSTTSDQNSNSITGCLNGADGNFTLTDQSGTTFQLKGATADLKQHVGHKVELMGATTGGDTTASASASSTGETQSSAMTNKSFTVTSVKHLSDTCSPSSANLGPGVSSGTAAGQAPGSVANPTNPGGTPESATAVEQQPTTTPPQNQTPSAGTAAPTTPNGSTGAVSEQTTTSQTTTTTTTTEKSHKKNKKHKKNKTTTPSGESTNVPPPSSTTPPPQL